MDIIELPASEQLVITNSADTIRKSLEKILGRFEGRMTFYFQPVFGSPRSERLISKQRLSKDSMPSEEPMNLDEVAKQILLLASPETVPPARFTPRERPEGKSPGWEIRRTLIKNIPAVYACAAWV